MDHTTGAANTSHVTDPGEMPWPLTRAEIESFHEYGLAKQSIVDFLDDEGRGPVRRWRVWFTAPRSA